MSAKIARERAHSELIVCHSGLLWFRPYDVIVGVDREIRQICRYDFAAIFECYRVVAGNRLVKLLLLCN